MNEGYVPQKEGAPEPKVIFTDLPLELMKERLVNSFPPASYCFAVSPNLEIVLTGKDHEYLEDNNGLDGDHALLQGIISAKEGILRVKFYQDEFRRTLLKGKSEERAEIEAQVTKALEDTFGDLNA